MSGVGELIGLTASLLALTELATKTSYALFKYARKVQHYRSSIDALSREISSTSTVLRIFADTLADDRYGQLCSAEAVRTAKQLAEDCKEVFGKLGEVVDPDGGKGKFGGVRFERFRFPFKEGEVEKYQANIERLKSSLALILNVLIMVGLYRRPEAMPVMVDQYRLVEMLDEETAVKTEKYYKVVRTIEGTDGGDGKAVPMALALNIVPDAKQVVKPPTQEKVVLPSGLEHHREDIFNHGRLVTNLLKEVVSDNYKLGLHHRLDLQNGILSVHWKSWSGMRTRYGYEIFSKMFADFKEVARYWSDQSETVQEESTPIVIMPRTTRPPAPINRRRSAYHYYSSSSSTSRSRSRDRDRSRDRVLRLEDMPYEVRHRIEQLEELKTRDSPQRMPKRRTKYRDYSDEMATEDVIIINNKLNIPGEFPKESEVKRQLREFPRGRDREREEHTGNSREKFDKWEREHPKERERNAALMHDSKGHHDSILKQALEKEDQMRKKLAAMEEKLQKQEEDKARDQFDKWELERPRKELKDKERLDKWEREREREREKEERAESERARNQIDRWELERPRKELKDKERLDKWEREREREHEKEERAEAERSRKAKEARESWKLEAEREREKKERAESKRAQEDREQAELELTKKHGDVEQKYRELTRELQELECGLGSETPVVTASVPASEDNGDKHDEDVAGDGEATTETQQSVETPLPGSAEHVDRVSGLLLKYSTLSPDEVGALLERS